ncbi:MAG: hypothetical protein WKG00_31870 [Polyangiaceae bacterium]
MRSAVLMAMGAAAVAGCNGNIGEGPAGNGQGPGNGPKGTGVECAVSRNDEVRLRLEPTCKGCHQQGANKPFFASLRAFEQALVYVPKYVTSGAPDESYLLELLAGHGSAPYKAMPPAGPPFAELAEAGKTQIGMAELEAWITDLPPPSPELAEPDYAAPSTRRLTAEEMLTSLQDQLGLEDADIEGSGLAVDVERFVALGGPNTPLGQARQLNFGPGAMQLLVAISQGWCSLSVKKASSPLLTKASLADGSASAAAGIRENIAAMELRMLGEVDDAEVEALFADVFVPYEAQGTDVAWTAVCAALVRHPRWVSF